MIFTDNSSVPQMRFEVTYFETLTPRERRRTPTYCADMGNIRVDLRTMGPFKTGDFGASIVRVLATLPEGSYWDDKAEAFNRLTIKDYRPPVRKPLAFNKVEEQVQALQTPVAKKPYIKFMGL